MNGAALRRERTETQGGVRFSSRQRFALISILLLAFVLRLYRLGVDSLWYDETVSALLASKSLAAMWAHTAGDIHPPFYYAILHFWTAAAGRSEFAYAFLSLGFGLATIPLLAHLGLRLYGGRTGVLAAFLVAVNPFSIWYAQEVRMYTLGVFLLLCALLLALNFVLRPNRVRRSAILYAIVAALALWTLYYSAFALIALNLFFIPWLWMRARRRLIPWLLAQAGAIVLFLPWLPIALRQAFAPPVPPWREAIPLFGLLLKVGREGATALALGQSLDPARWWPLGLLGLGLAALAFWAPARRWRPDARWATPTLLWTTLLGPILLILLISGLFTPLYHVRYFVLYSAAYPVLAAAGLLFVAENLTALPRPVRFGVAGLLLLLLLGGAAISLRNYHRNRFAYEAADDLRGAVRLIYERMGPRDAVLIDAGYLYPAFVAYWPDEIGWLGRLSEYSPENWAENGPTVVLTGHVDGDPDIGWGDPNSDFYAISRAETAQRLEQLFADADTVWLLRGYDTVNDPTGFIRAWLEEHGDNSFDQVVPGQTFVRVQAWRTTQSPRGEMPESATAAQTRFGDGILLLGYELSPPQPRAGEPIRLSLYWRRVGAIDKAYKVFVQLLDEAGQVAAQDDAEPGRGAFPTDQWRLGEVVSSSFVLHPPAGLAAGKYRIITGFYDGETGVRLETEEGEDAVTLVGFSWP
jgi:4-amino-4-deoxy-L-arabinose transferase-like glycosyltransferase